MASAVTMSRAAFRTVAFDFLSQAKLQRADPSLPNNISKLNVISSAVNVPTTSVQTTRPTRPTESSLSLPPNPRHFAWFKSFRSVLRWRTVGRSFLLLALFAAFLSFTLPVPEYARSSPTEVLLMLISSAAVPTIDRLVRFQSLIYYNLLNF